MVDIRIRMKGQPEAEVFYEAVAALLGLVIGETGAKADITIRSTGETESQELLVPEFMSKRGA